MCRRDRYQYQVSQNSDFTGAEWQNVDGDMPYNTLTELIGAAAADYEKHPYKAQDYELVAADGTTGIYYIRFRNISNLDQELSLIHI